MHMTRKFEFEFNRDAHTAPLSTTTSNDKVFVVRSLIVWIIVAFSSIIVTIVLVKVVGNGVQCNISLCLSILTTTMSVATTRLIRITESIIITAGTERLIFCVIEENEASICCLILAYYSIDIMNEWKNVES